MTMLIADREITSHWYHLTQHSRGNIRCRSINMDAAVLRDAGITTIFCSLQNHDIPSISTFRHRAITSFSRACIECICITIHTLPLAPFRPRDGDFLSIQCKLVRDNSKIQYIRRADIFCCSTTNRY